MNKRIAILAALFAALVLAGCNLASQKSVNDLNSASPSMSEYRTFSAASEEELAVAYGDERLEIGFNAKYLLEIASQVDRENAVFLFNTANEPTLMREGGDLSAVYVVMPMRV